MQVNLLSLFVIKKRLHDELRADEQYLALEENWILNNRDIKSKTYIKLQYDFAEPPPTLYILPKIFDHTKIRPPPKQTVQVNLNFVLFSVLVYTSFFHLLT